MEPLISVVIPAYNVGPYLGNCLDSVLNQTYPNIEILLVDDGSTDETAEIADRYQAMFPQKVRTIHTKNQGVTRARLEGVRAAKGDWIGFVDGDDEIEADMYERLYRNAEKFQADISHCGHRTIVNGGERIHDFYNTGRLVKQDRQAGLKDLLAGSFEPSLCSKLFRNTLLHSLLQSGEMDTTVRYYEDLLMNFFLFRKAKSTVMEDFCGYHYLARSSSATRSQFRAEKSLDPIRVRKRILDEVDPELKDLAWQKYLVTCCGAYAGLTGMEGYEEITAEIRRILCENRDKWKLLSRIERFKLRLMLFSVGLYRGMYRLYEKYLQRKVYE